MGIIHYGNALQKLVKESGFTQAQIAESLGVARTTVSQYFEGENPSLNKKAPALRSFVFISIFSNVFWGCVFSDISSARR